MASKTKLALVAAPLPEGPVAMPIGSAGVQIRLMGPDPAVVARAAKMLAETGLVQITGSKGNARGPGVRVYGSVKS